MFLAAKNASCAALKRAQSFASSLGLPRPAAFHWSIKVLKVRAVATQSVEVASFSACSTNVALVPLTALDCASRVAKCWRRRLSNLLREDEKRFQRSASAFLSNRGAAFHSSRSVFKRSPVAFQLSESARDSASAMIFSFASMIPVRRSAFAAASAAFLASCAARPPSISGRI